MGTGRNGWAIVFVGVVLLLFAVPSAWAQCVSAIAAEVRWYSRHRMESSWSGTLKL